MDGIDVQRARQRFTLNYRFSDRLQAGIEWNPLVDEVGPLVNWTALRETERRPALILGTSSDRIGTEDGQAYYGTLSKNLSPWVGLPLSPYAGLSYREQESDWELVGGLSYPLFGERLFVTHLWDGANLHLTLDVPLERAVVGLVLVQQEDPAPDEGKEYFLGLTFGLRLPQPGFLRGNAP